MASACGADIQANEILVNLLQGQGLVPKPIEALENADLTTRTIGGDGTFDAIMASLGVHLKAEYEASRITGAEYTKAYIGLVSAALQTATAFLLGRDQAYWQAVLAQQQARTAEAEYALTKMRIASEDANYCNLKAQKELINQQTAQLKQQVEQVVPLQIIGLTKDNTSKELTNTDILPRQRDLLQEQIEVQRSQTMDTRTTGVPIAGLANAQKGLWSQQIISYKRDAEVKAAKIFSDAWITQKTIDEGLLPPNAFTNGVIDNIMGTLKTNNQL